MKLIVQAYDESFTTVSNEGGAISIEFDNGVDVSESWTFESRQEAQQVARALLEISDIY